MWCDSKTEERVTLGNNFTYKFSVPAEFLTEMSV